MNGEQIIEQFNLYVDDGSELSSEEELQLLNKVYRQVLDEKDWVFLRKPFSGSTSTSVPYIALPADFKNIAVNYYEDQEPDQVVFVGTTFDKYKIIPFSQRRNYRDVDGYCYLDMLNRRLYFTKQPTAVKTVEYDYLYAPDDLTLATAPVFDPTGVLGHSIIIMHGMVVDFYSIEATEKERAYYNENAAAYNKVLGRMANVNLKNYGSLNY